MPKEIEKVRRVLRLNKTPFTSQNGKKGGSRPGSVRGRKIIVGYDRKQLKRILTKIS